jgi:hypothetical protein
MMLSTLVWSDRLSRWRRVEEFTEPLWSPP